jgi:hypothetical protein
MAVEVPIRPMMALERVLIVRVPVVDSVRVMPWVMAQILQREVGSGMVSVTRLLARASPVLPVMLAARLPWARPRA